MYTREPNSSAGGELLNQLGAPQKVIQLPQPTYSEAFLKSVREILADDLAICAHCTTIYHVPTMKQMWNGDEKFCCWECRDNYEFKHSKAPASVGFNSPRQIDRAANAEVD